MLFRSICAVVLILIFGFNGETDAKTVAVSKFFDAKAGIVSQGVIETKEVDINSKVPGRVMKVYVQEGQEVKAGDALIEISSEELQAKKTQAEAGVKQAEAALKAAKETYEQAQAGVDAAEAVVKDRKSVV